MQNFDAGSARCLVILGSHDSFGSGRRSASASADEPPAIAAVGEAVACREGRWVVAVAPMERHRSPDLAQLRIIARRAEADPFSAVVEAFGPGRARSIFALAGPPGVIAGSSAAIARLKSASVRCDPPRGAVRLPASTDAADGWLPVPGGHAIAWGSSGPEALVDLRTGVAELYAPG